MEDKKSVSHTNLSTSDEQHLKVRFLKKKGKIVQTSDTLPERNLSLFTEASSEMVSVEAWRSII